MYTQQDFSGLSVYADMGLVKHAAEYGNLPELSIGSKLFGEKLGPAADIGMYFIPGVGSVLSGYDALRNGMNAFSDLKRGKFLSAAGNLGSAALNTLFMIPGLGAVGKAVGKGGQMLMRGGKAMRAGSRTAKAMTAAGNGMARMGTSLGNAGKAYDAWHAARHPAVNGFWKKTGRTVGSIAKPMAGFTATGMATAIGDANYEAKQQNQLNTRMNRVYGGYTPTSMSGYVPNSTIPQAGTSYSRMWSPPTSGYRTATAY